MYTNAVTKNQNYRKHLLQTRHTAVW